ncbi:hypothetical protein [Pantoea sp. SORGH_AS_0659]|uniref:hypothetical protein n=1 Tax=Pantoea sp. SORGH_AS_0659 TaxID=3062597 RepID=UPI00285DC5CB|nr:hypothetical protein [Pantoea sp. SORGH_AS_0659]MDR6352609.1 hypothetical protein [Pantoea sp. SORGH_AS_0659]
MKTGHICHKLLFAHYLKDVNSNPNGNGSFPNEIRGVSNSPLKLRVPNVIHHFWQGAPNAFLKHAGNLNKTAKMNPKYDVQLHVLSENKKDLSVFNNNLIGVKVLDMEKEGWYQNFRASERCVQFDASRLGPRPHLASGADIIKTELLASEGGVWNDVDNNPVSSLPETIVVDKNQILTAGPVTFLKWGKEEGVHSSTLATHKDNNLLKEINKKSLSNFNEVKDTIYKVNSQTDNPEEHFRLVSQTAGSLHLSRELAARVEGHKESVHALIENGEKFNDQSIIMDKYFTPVASTGSGTWDEEQARTFLEMISPPGHVVI